MNQKDSIRTAPSVPNSTGTYRLSDGNWGFRFTVRVDGKNVSRKNTKDANGNPLKTQAAAIRARKAAIKALQNEPTSESLCMSSKTIAEIYEEYRRSGCADRSYATIKKQDSLWRNHIQMKYGARCVAQLNPADINDYLCQLYYREGFAFRYVESFLKFFYLIYGRAYTRGYISQEEYHRACRNKDTRIRMPKLKADDDMAVIVFTQAECTVMDEYFAGTNAETAYLLGRYCGLRINECYGLKWADIDLEKGIIRIRQQMQYQEGLIKLVSLKTRHAYRDIVMCSKLVEYFKRLMALNQSFTAQEEELRQQNMTMITDVDGSKISSLELVNSLRDGKIQTINSMKYHTRQLLRKGIRFKFHYLRHTFGTHLANLNTPSHILCNQMGHGNIHVTERYYLTVSQTGIEILKNNLDRL